QDLPKLAGRLDKKEAERIRPILGAQTLVLSLYEADEALKADLRLHYGETGQAEKARDAVQAQVSETLSLLKGQHDLIMQQPAGASLCCPTSDTRASTINSTLKSLGPVRKIGLCWGKFRLSTSPRWRRRPVSPITKSSWGPAPRFPAAK